MTDARPADARLDYRFFRALYVLTSRLVLANLFLIAWNELFYRHGDTRIFLLTTTVLALGVSLASSMVAYRLFKRRGGKIEKTSPPSSAAP